PAGLRCRRGEVPISLTPKEFAVLHGLARRAGEVVSKKELLAQAWDFSYDGDPNIVEVFVSALRRKIDQPFGRTTLVTVRGAGYRLEAESRRSRGGDGQHRLPTGDGTRTQAPGAKVAGHGAGCGVTGRPGCELPSTVGGA